MDRVVPVLILTFLTFLLAGLVLPAERTEEEEKKEKEGEEEKEPELRLSPGLVARLNTSTFTTCSSNMGSKGVRCPGFHLGDGCLRDFLWCRGDLTVVCGDHGLTSNNDLFCGNHQFWARAGGCWLTDSEGSHRGVRCSGARSGQCIFPVYSGSLPVLRTCEDHSNQIFAENYVCYGGSMNYSREEYPHCQTDCERRSARRCWECLDTNLCTASCLQPGPGCPACTNPAYFRCEAVCLHPALVCDGVSQCARGQDEDPARCDPVYRRSDLAWKQAVWRTVNN